MQGETFEADMRLLKLGGYHIVLGVDRMKGVSLISFDSNKMEVSLEKEGQGVILQGNVEMVTCKMIKGKKVAENCSGTNYPRWHNYFQSRLGRNQKVIRSWKGSV